MIPKDLQDMRDECGSVLIRRAQRHIGVASGLLYVGRLYDASVELMLARSAINIANWKKRMGYRCAWLEKTGR